MGKPLSTKIKKAPSPLQALWRPMLFLAVGIHAILLFMPLGDAKKELPKVTEQPLTFNRLPDAKPTPKAAPKPAPKPSPQATAAAATPAPPPRLTSPAVVAPTDTSDTETDTDSTPDAGETSLARSGSSTPSGSTTPPPPAPATPASPAPTVAVRQRPDLDDLTQQLVERLVDLEGRPTEAAEDVAALLPDGMVPDFFVNAASKERKPGFVGIEFVATQKVDELYENLALIYPDYTFKQVGEYGGGPVYEVKKKEGETKQDDLRYFNLVKSKEGNSTLIALWKQKPDK